MLKNLNILSNELTCTKQNELLANHTTIGTGGKCALLVLPCSQNEICKTIDFCRKNDVLYTKMGNGSNLIVADDGFNGVVIKLGKNFSKVSVHGCDLFAESGATGKKVPGGSVVNNSSANAGDARDVGSIPGSERSFGAGNGKIC